MNFSLQQISSDKWGIYSDARLLATVGCKETCEIILSNLANGRKDVPNTHVNSLYQSSLPLENAPKAKVVLDSKPRGGQLKSVQLRSEQPKSGQPKGGKAKNTASESIDPIRSASASSHSAMPKPSKEVAQLSHPQISANSQVPANSKAATTRTGAPQAQAS
jgi:hypothetical protein